MLATGVLTGCGLQRGSEGWIGRGGTPSGPLPSWFRPKCGGQLLVLCRTYSGTSKEEQKGEGAPPSCPPFCTLSAVRCVRVRSGREAARQHTHWPRSADPQLKGCGKMEFRGWFRRDFQLLPVSSGLPCCCVCLDCDACGVCGCLVRSILICQHPSSPPRLDCFRAWKPSPASKRPAMSLHAAMSPAFSQLHSRHAPPRPHTPFSTRTTAVARHHDQLHHLRQHSSYAYNVQLLSASPSGRYSHQLLSRVLVRSIAEGVPAWETDFDLLGSKVRGVVTRWTPPWHPLH